MVTSLTFPPRETMHTIEAVICTLPEDLIERNSPQLNIVATHRLQEARKYGADGKSCPRSIK